MIDLDHYEALKTSHEEITKKNVHLNAQLNHLKKDHDEFVVKTLEKLKSTIGIYDNANENVIDYIERNFANIDVNKVRSFFPMRTS